MCILCGTYSNISKAHFYSFHTGTPAEESNMNLVFRIEYRHWTRPGEIAESVWTMTTPSVTNNRHFDSETKMP